MAAGIRVPKAVGDGRVGRNETALLFNCATGLKYPMPDRSRTFDRHSPINFAAL